MKIKQPLIHFWTVVTLGLAMTSYSEVHQGKRIPGEYLIKAQSKEEVREAFGEFQIREIKTLSEGLYLLKLKKDPGPKAMMKEGNTSPGIQSVQPNYAYWLNSRSG